MIVFGKLYVIVIVFDNLYAIVNVIIDFCLKIGTGISRKMCFPCFFFQLKLSLINGTTKFRNKERYETLQLCELDIQRSSFANHLKTAGIYLKLVKKRDICKLTAQATELKNHLVSDSHKMNRKILKKA